MQPRVKLEDERGRLMALVDVPMTARGEWPAAYLWKGSAYLPVKEARHWDPAAAVHVPVFRRILTVAL